MRSKIWLDLYITRMLRLCKYYQKPKCGSCLCDEKRYIVDGLNFLMNIVMILNCVVRRYGHGMFFGYCLCCQNATAEMFQNCYGCEWDVRTNCCCGLDMNFDLVLKGRDPCMVGW